MRVGSGESFCSRRGKPASNLSSVLSGGVNINGESPSPKLRGVCAGAGVAFVFANDPSVKCDVAPPVLECDSGDGNPPPDDVGQCGSLEEWSWLGAVEVPGVEGESRPMLNGTGTDECFLFLRGVPPSVPAPSSRPGRFWSRL